MNDEMYQCAVRRLLDLKAPDVHMEILLMFGPQPPGYTLWASAELMWSENVVGYLQTRYAYTGSSAHLTTVVNIIAGRIRREQSEAIAGAARS
jgi:hypothetical protein